MRPRLPKSRADKLKLALSLWAVVLTLNVVVFYAGWVIRDVTLGPSPNWSNIDLRPVFAWHVVRSISGLVEIVLWLLLLQLILDIRILRAPRQTLSLRLIQAVQLLHIPLSPVWIITSIESFLNSPLQTNRPPSILPTWLLEASASAPVYWTMQCTWLAVLIAWIIFALPPSFRLSNWKPWRERIFRFLIITSPVIYLIQFISRWINAWDPYTWLFINYGIDMPYANVLIFPPGILAPYLNHWVEHAIIALTVGFLVYLRRNAKSLLDFPNHCPTCHYPLDPHMHTCPECGSPRPAQPTTKPTPKPLPPKD